jgi:hypothetical protein
MTDTSLDMNAAPEAKAETQDVTIEQLLQIIGQKEVELRVHDAGFKKFEEQAIAMAKQFSATKTELASLKVKGAEPTPPPPELEQLRKANVELTAALKAEQTKPIPVSPELEQLRRVNAADDEHVLQLEKKVHEVALERDAVGAELKTSRDKYTDLQYVCDDLQKKIDELQKPVIIPPAPVTRTVIAPYVEPVGTSSAGTKPVILETKKLKKK